VAFQTAEIAAEQRRSTELSAQVSGAKALRWAGLPREERKNLVVATVRMLVFAGCRGKAVARNKFSSGPALAQAQQELRRTFGLEISSTRAFEELNTAKTEKLFVYNGLSNPHLREQGPGANSGSAGARKAFTWLVFQCIWTSPGQRITLAQLLKHLRELDARVPKSTSLKVKKGRAEIPELGEPVGQLLAELADEGYVVFTPHEVEKDDEQKGTISFGQRFLLEVGHKQAVQGYFDVLGEPVDEAVLQEVTGLPQNEPAREG
jgi:hypothetical protein